VGDGLPGDEHPVVDGTGQLVDGQVDVGGRVQLAATAGPQERHALALALGSRELGREAGRAGKLLYALVRAIRPETVVEFGTSFGISTIYLASGALVAADDITHASMAEYLDYIRDPASGYVTVAFPVEDGMEISSWTGR
jgi:hypothetical protein